MVFALVCLRSQGPGGLREAPGDSGNANVWLWKSTRGPLDPPGPRPKNLKTNMLCGALLNGLGSSLVGFHEAELPSRLGSLEHTRSGMVKLHREPRKPFQKVGGFASHLLEGFPGPPGQLRPQKQTFIKPCPTWGGVCSKLPQTMFFIVSPR
jgi:hypothetical protein